MIAVYPDTHPTSDAGTDGAAGDSTFAGIVETLSRALQLHDYRRGTFGETAAHMQRVAQLGSELAERVAPELATDPQLAAGFRLHDIGMIGIPVQMLAKQAALSPDELNEIREHPWLGERIVAPLECLNGVARQVIACHHEQWDGSGYPRGLRAAEIPLAARIFAVVDAYESMTNPQPYREALPLEYAFEELAEKAGAHFDASVVDAFLALGAPHAPAAA